MSTPIPVTLIGATGLTGSATLHALLSSSTPSSGFAITTIGRKAISSDKATINPNTTFTHTLMPDMFEAPKSQVGTKGGVYISCLGTTRAAAGGLKEQERIDVDLNRDLALKAKEDGAERLILVSSKGSGPLDNHLPYSRMKVTLENAVKGMDFKSCVILKPGILMGERKEARSMEATTQRLFRGMQSIGLPLSGMMVEGDDVGACIAYYAANPPSERVTIVDNAHIIETAKKWREAQGSAAAA